MKALILDGSRVYDAAAEKVATALRDRLAARGWEIEHIPLRDKKIGNCAGDFFCWVRSPGVCNTNDDNRAIAAQVMACDLMVWLTPVTFGGYSAALKRMVDHLIQNILPFFTQVGGEVHHQRRYDRYPDMLVVGWMDAPDAAGEAIFRNLVQRNARNFYPRTHVCGVVTGSPSAEDLAAQADDWLDAVDSGRSSPVPALPAASSAAAVEPARSALLLVGSPRTASSTSATLGGYLFEQLDAKGVATQTIQLYTHLVAPARQQALLAAIDGADLIVLAAPVYVDSLPGPVIGALELIAAKRAGRSGAQRFAAIANCGFPEAHQCNNLLAQCARFADRAGLGWAGGMALGAGGAINGVALAKLGGRTLATRQALDMAAAALSSGQAIPGAAADLLAKPSMPDWLYTASASLGWWYEAARNRVLTKMRRAPYRRAH